MSPISTATTAGDIPHEPPRILLAGCTPRASAGIYFHCDEAGHGAWMIDPDTRVARAG